MPDFTSCLPDRASLLPRRADQTVSAPIVGGKAGTWASPPGSRSMVGGTKRPAGYADGSPGAGRGYGCDWLTWKHATSYWDGAPAAL